MPRGPKGEKRPADVIGKVMRIATGEEANTLAADRREQRARKATHYRSAWRADGRPECLRS
jgi:hypothetical protein